MHVSAMNAKDLGRVPIIHVVALADRVDPALGSDVLAGERRVRGPAVPSLPPRLLLSNLMGVESTT